MSNTKQHELITRISKPVFKCSDSMLSQVLRGHKNFSFKKAKVAAEFFNTTINVWMDPDLVTVRKAAWKQFKGSKEE